MEGTRDPWIGASFSWSLAGLGQFYAGRRMAGVFFLILELLLWSGWLAWTFVPSIPMTGFYGLCAAMLVFWILSATDAYQALRPPTRPEGKSPWKALFFSRVFPGAGHFYAGHKFRGILLVLVTGIAAEWVRKKSESAVGEWAVYFAGRTLLLLDPFFLLKGRNTLPRRATLWSLLAIVLFTQSWIPFLILKGTVAEVYKVPGSSMEPTVMGDASAAHSVDNCPFASAHQTTEGDRVLVSQLAYRLGDIRRFDVAVFRFPLQPSKFYVKRVAGLPGEQILIHAGDLYAKNPGEPRFRIQRKPIEVQDGLWFPRDDGAAAPALSTPGRSAFTLKGTPAWSDAPATREVRGPIPDPSGTGISHRDVKQTVLLHTGPGRTELALRVRNPAGDFEALLSTAGPGQWVVRRPGRADATAPLDPLQPDREFRIESMIFDGQWIVRVNGKESAPVVFVTELEAEDSAAGDADEAALGLRGDGAIVRGYALGIDLYYRGRNYRDMAWGDDQALIIPSGSYVVLGDNVANSHDSRSWVKTSFHLKDGSTVTCEDQQVIHSYSNDFLRYLQKQLKLPKVPDVGIDGDSRGEEVGLFNDQIKEVTKEPFRFVERGYFVGKATKVWWPPERAKALR
jgi:signal peptidase I